MEMRPSFDSPRGAVGALSYWKEIAHIRTKHGLSETQGRYMTNRKDSKKAILVTHWTVTLHPLAEHELQTIPADMQAVGNTLDWPRWYCPCCLRCRAVGALCWCCMCL